MKNSPNFLSGFACPCNDNQSIDSLNLHLTHDLQLKGIDHHKYFANALQMSIVQVLAITLRSLSE